MAHGKKERGFSLILVMIAIVVITLVGTTVVYTSGADLLSAGARQRASLARQVAEAGLNHYALLVQPSLLPPANLVGNAPEEGFVYEDVLANVPPIHTQTLPSAPPGYSATYVVWPGAKIDDGAQIIIEGRLHPANDPGGQVLARSRISTVIVMTSGSDGYSGTVGWTPRNTGVLGGGDGEGYAGW